MQTDPLVSSSDASAPNWSQAAGGGGQTSNGLPEEEIVMNPHYIELQSTSDILSARLEARALAIELGFSGFAVTLIVAAISRVARQIVGTSRCGEIHLCELKQGSRSGIMVKARARFAATGKRPSHRFGIDCAGRALSESVETLKNTLDELSVCSGLDGDATVIMKQWL